jgi:hypothetical protein
MMKKTKFGIKHYMRPTPSLMRKLGDSILIFSSTISVYAIAEEIKWLALTTVFLGAAGKFITNLFTEEENGETETVQQLD